MLSAASAKFFIFMALIDILIITLIVVGAIIGYCKGLAAGIGSLAGLVIGILACRMFGSVVAEAIMSMFENTEVYVATILAYITVFLIFFFGIKLVAWLLKESLKALNLGGIDRLSGAVFGALEWLLLLSVVLNGLYALTPELSLFHSSHLLGGRIFDFVMSFAPWAWGVDIIPNSVG